MKISKLRELSLDELRARGRELKQEALQTRIQKATGQLENKSALKTLRKENARIETIMSERRLGLNVGKDAAESVKPKPAKTSQPTTAVATKKTAAKPTSKKAAVKKPTVKKQAE